CPPTRWPQAPNSVILAPFFCSQRAASDRVPPVARPGVQPEAAARRNAYTFECPPRFLTSLAVRTCSLLERRAGIESEVLVPGPLTRPPVANLETSTLSSFQLSLPMNPAIGFHIFTRPLL